MKTARKARAKRGNSLIGVRLGEKLLRAARQRASKTGCTLQQVIRAALAEQLGLAERLAEPGTPGPKPEGASKG